MFDLATPVLLLAYALVQGASDSEELYAPPKDSSSQPAWLEKLREERASLQREINFTGAIYEDPVVNWTRVSYVQPQTHLYDRFLYSADEHKYTIERYLDDVRARYGGIDSILLWPTYTNIGIDARNQFDYFRALPGGLDGLKRLVNQFKARGVRVLLAYNPWDEGLRPEGEPQWLALARLLKEVNADGFNGDTMQTMYKQFWTAGVGLGHKIVGEMEGGGYKTGGGRKEDDSWDSAHWDPMGWAEAFHDGKLPDGITAKFAVAPGVDKLKWLDGRHMTHVCDRWAKNRTDAMQYAYINGDGYESWENVWGIFMQFTPRDGEALRRIATLWRWLGPEQFIQGYVDWVPYAPELAREPHQPYSEGGLVASRFVHASGDCVWLVVNRAASANVAEIDLTVCRARSYVYDLYHGKQLPPDTTAKVDVEPNGYGAILATARQELPVASLLATMESLTTRPLESYSAAWAPLPQEMIGISGPTRYAETPHGMVLVPLTSYHFRTAGVEIEGGCDLSRDSWGVCCPSDPPGPCPGSGYCKTPCAYPAEDSRGVDAQFPWETAPGRFHDRSIEVGPFFIDRHLVTKAEYAAYLRETGYSPRDPYNFLVGWSRASVNTVPSPPPGSEQEPVVWISLSEAREYCRWAGKRLPHTYEWQLAAQGIDGRIYPWGNDASNAGGSRFPTPSNGTEVPPLPSVTAFSPAGDSVFGMAGAVGIVWQYTDEFQDAHTRTVLLKGSSLYTPMLGSTFPALPQSLSWYFPKALQLDRHGRMMLMDDSYERAATLGFRCAADHVSGQEAPHHYRDLGSTKQEPQQPHLFQDIFA